LPCINRGERRNNETIRKDFVTHVIRKRIRAENVSLRVASNDDIAVASVNDCLASLKKIRGVGSGEMKRELA
jgi:hypothetical protein